jgi:hypothetical protein
VSTPTHVVNIMFRLPADFPAGGISNARQGCMPSPPRSLGENRPDVINVCFATLCRLKSDITEGPRSAKSCRERVQQNSSGYSITSSARASTVSRISRPSASAVFRLITGSYLVGAWTGRSAGFAPLRIRPA